MPNLFLWVVALRLAGVASEPAMPPQPDSCAALAQLGLPEAKVVAATPVSAGAFAPPANLPPWLAGDPSLYKTLAAFCRVTVEVAPSPDSTIRVEVWMPQERWNGKFRGQGNGGFAGAIDFRAMANAVAQGYGTAGTDTGHSGEATDASWALGHPEKVIDFGYRGIHSMTTVAKRVLVAFYGRKPQHSYFGSCSNGGRQALMEAQRFPEDYDGILAGAPANAWTSLLTKALADAQATAVDPATYVASGKLPALARAVNAACDALDGVTDGVVNDPRQCRFDPEALACRDGESDSCLTPPQVTALRRLYAGPRDSRGQEIFPGFVPGAEEGNGGWGTWITGAAPGKSLLFAFATGYFSNMVYERADWDYRGAKVEEAFEAAQKKTAQILDATEANLAAFKDRGGKLILYHGWNDPAISALNAIRYYDNVASRLGRAETDAFVRLYMVPGMQHCDGGPGPNSFGQHGAAPAREPQRDVFTALEQWVEKGTPPSEIVATKYVDDDLAKGVKTSRPLCPHPLIAKYRGQGSPNEATSFVCAPPGG